MPGQYSGFRPRGGHLLSKGPQATRGPQAIRGPGNREPFMTTGAHGVIRGLSGIQGHINETLISIFLPSKRRFIQCSKKYPGAWGAPWAPSVLREGPWPLCPPLGTSLVDAQCTRLNDQSMQDHHDISPLLQLFNAYQRKDEPWKLPRCSLWQPASQLYWWRSCSCSISSSSSSTCLLHKTT